MAIASLGTQTIEEIHEEAILLWIHLKQKDEDANPADGIFFALTNQTWPRGVPKAGNAIELCSVLNQVFGVPQLSEEERKALNVKAFMLFHNYSSGWSPIRYIGYLTWANRIAYALAVLSLLVSGLSWWVLGLVFVAWSCFRAARTAARMGKEEPRPAWEVPAIRAMHLVALVALFAVSLLHLLNN